MFEKMTFFGIPESQNNAVLVYKNIYIGNVLLNKGSTDVEANEKFKLALKILKEYDEAK